MLSARKKRPFASVAVSVFLQTDVWQRYSQLNAQRVANRPSRRLMVHRIVKTKSPAQGALVGLHPPFRRTQP
jgi:hypothetical protein